jgi:hypothetical protein
MPELSGLEDGAVLRIRLHVASGANPTLNVNCSHRTLKSQQAANLYRYAEPKRIHRHNHTPMHYEVVAWRNTFEKFQTFATQQRKFARSREPNLKKNGYRFINRATDINAGRTKGTLQIALEYALDTCGVVSGKRKR